MSKIFIGGGILANIYHWTHPKVSEDKIPYWYKRSITGELWHLIRKGICQNIAPNCVLTPVRIGLYRMCGFKIGKGCFIGMKCYLDDLCVDKIIIGNNVTSITARHDIEIGEGALIGAMALVNKSVPAGTTAVGVPCRVIDTGS